MRLPERLVGSSAGPLVQDIDARWLMAYAAALGDTDPEYLDTTRPDGIAAHPLFAVCYEWPLALELRAKTLSEAIAIRSVHASHDLRLHRRARPGDRLSTRATVISLEPKAPGAYVTTRFETVDAGGRPVSTTDYGSIYRGVECDAVTLGDSPPLAGRHDVGGAAAQGPPTAAERPRGGAGRREAPAWAASVAIAPALAHVYTECARIWNPIHTDKSVARAAGLPDIILHGTAVLALALSAVLRREPLGAATPISRVACRFRGMVRLPSAIRIEGEEALDAPDGRRLSFRAVAEDGRPAIDDGLLVLAPRP